MRIFFDSFYASEFWQREGLNFLNLDSFSKISDVVITRFDQKGTSWSFRSDGRAQIMFWGDENVWDLVILKNTG